MSKLFKKKNPEEVRAKRVPILFTSKEFEKVERDREVRKLSVAEHCRRAILNKRSDIQFDVDIVLALSDCTRAIRELYAKYLEQGIPPPETELADALSNAKAAMLRVEK